MIRTRYNILLSVGMLHDYYGGPFSDLKLVPTPDCLAALDDCGLLYREAQSGFVLLFGENEQNQIVRKINSLTRFRFLLQIQNPAFSNVTKLVYPDSEIGRPYYYVSNRTDTGAIDNSTVLANTAGNVGARDYCPLVGSNLTIPLDGTVTQLSLTQLVQGVGKKTLVTRPATGLPKLTLHLSELETAPGKKISLPSGRYLIELAGPTPATIPIYYEAQPLPTSWGIIELYKDQSTNYTAQTAYTLTFRADSWKYFLIDPTGKVTINPAGTDLANLTTSTTGLGGLSLGWVKETDIEADTWEQRYYALLKARNAGTPIYLLRSNRGMTQTAETAVNVKLTLGGVETVLPTPRGNRSTLDVIQTL